MRHDASDRRASLSRRTFVQGLGVAAGAALGGLPPRPAAADGKMVLGTWGGDYSKLLTQNVETPILKAKGIEVVHDIAGDPQRRAKLVAEKRLPRGTTDLQALAAAGSFEMWQAGVLEDP
jgi:putative spermidine/putrescine transport system substrate-binding protein